MSVVRAPAQWQRGGASAVVSPADDADIAWGAAFQQFSWTHLVTLGCCIAVIAAVAWVGRRHRRSAGLARGVVDAPGQVLGALVLVHWFALQAWWNFPVRYGNEFRLPLQLCDVAGLVAGAALLSGRRFISTTLYFWAFALSTQAYVTPIVTVGPAYARYWLFWESHTAIIGSAVYIVAVRGYRPRGRDFLVGVGMTVAYVAVVLPLNLVFGWNYGYVGRGEPGARTLIDQLGPWPWRLAPLFGLGVGAFLIVWLPWALADKYGGRKTDDGGGGSGAGRG